MSQWIARLFIFGLACVNLPANAGVAFEMFSWKDIGRFSMTLRHDGQTVSLKGDLLYTQSAQVQKDGLTVTIKSYDAGESFLSVIITADGGNTAMLILLTGPDVFTRIHEYPILGNAATMDQNLNEVLLRLKSSNGWGTAQTFRKLAEFGDETGARIERFLQEIETNQAIALATPKPNSKEDRSGPTVEIELGGEAAVAERQMMEQVASRVAERDQEMQAYLPETNERPAGSPEPRRVVQSWLRSQQRQQEVEMQTEAEVAAAAAAAQAAATEREQQAPATTKRRVNMNKHKVVEQPKPQPAAPPPAPEPVVKKRVAKSEPAPKAAAKKQPKPTPAPAAKPAAQKPIAKTAPKSEAAPAAAPKPKVKKGKPYKDLPAPTDKRPFKGYQP